MPKPILILNGPNLNMLGAREPDVYGHETLEMIEKNCEAVGKKLGLAIDFKQSNMEGEMISLIQKAKDTHQGIIINAGGYTHTSVALLDALSLTSLPIIEVHLSNIYKREEFRQTSYISRISKGVICGFGGHGYTLALEAMKGILDGSKKG